MANGVMVMRAFNQRVTENGRRVVDLLDSFGSFYASAPVMSHVSFPLYVPRATDTEVTYYPEVVVGFAQGEHRPIVIGAMDSYDVLYAPGESEGPATTAGVGDLRQADDDDAYTYLDEVCLSTVGGGAMFRLRNGGKALLRSPDISLQVGSGGLLRISDGRDGLHNVATSLAVTTQFNTVAAKLRELQQRIDELSLALANVVVTPATSTLSVIIPGLPPTIIPVLGTLVITPHRSLREPSQDIADDQLASPTVWVPPPADNS